MASITTARITPPSDRFPAGTVVGAYRGNAWSGADKAVAPTGAADATATVQADGSLTFTGLADNTSYHAYAAGSGAAVRFSTRHDRADDQVYKNSVIYVAVAGGGADDTAVIQAALDAANAAGGGDVLLPAGIYDVTGVTIYANVRLRGQGLATTLRLRTGTNASKDVIQTSGFSGLTGGASTSGPDHFEIADLIVDGNKANNATARHGIAIYGQAYRIRNVIVQNCAARGMQLEGNGTSEMEAHVYDFKVKDCGTEGIYMAGPHDTSFTNGEVIRCGSDTTAGVIVDAFSTMWSGVHVWGPGLYAWWIKKSNTILRGCQGEGAGVPKAGGAGLAGNAQLFIDGASNVSVDDGCWFFGVAGTTCNGIKLNSTGSNYIRAKVTTIYGVVLVVVSDNGASFIDLKIDGTFGTRISGTPSWTSHVVMNEGDSGYGKGEAFMALGNSGTALTIDMATRREAVATMTLTGNVTLTISNMYPGAKLLLEVTQDATGGRTITWPANVKKPGGALQPTATIGAIDVFELYAIDPNNVRVVKLGAAMA